MVTMTGPEHYREAERLLNEWGFSTARGATVAPPADVMALAQVHATLALAAAMSPSVAAGDAINKTVRLSSRRKP
jgi:hypothetical protein